MKLTNKQKFAIRCAVISGVMANSNLVERNNHYSDTASIVHHATDYLIKDIESRDDTNPEEQEGD